MGASFFIVQAENRKKLSYLVKQTDFNFIRTYCVVYLNTGKEYQK
ncbi:hypothetical protein CLOSTHATH_05891 [Hungatella hathewayi DSM 13479]|uniref:Uncharacterized protein n=1 Tax=Hungatella hathewayi DSM 13479 TaxID=566550 RepID=D3AQI5_9FIRM|nr:hypothetical protein CLOSTHATH_05891 [Hungatella hathewayi DSM 13479]